MAARPLAANESERNFMIGGTGYVLPRSNGELALDPNAARPAVGRPEQTHDSINAGGSTLRTVKLHSRYQNHIYAP